MQDPEEALYPGMPTSALANVVVDAVVPSTLVAQTLSAMVVGEYPPPRTAAPPQQAVPAGGRADPTSHEGLTTICPECGGVLREREEAGVMHWECRVGHRYSPESLVNAQAETVESALWAAVRGLEDHGALLERTAARLESNGQSVSARVMFSRATDISVQANAVRDALGDLHPAGASAPMDVDPGGSAPVDMAAPPAAEPSAAEPPPAEPSAAEPPSTGNAGANAP